MLTRAMAERRRNAASVAGDDEAARKGRTGRPAKEPVAVESSATSRVSEPADLVFEPAYITASADESAAAASLFEPDLAEGDRMAASLYRNAPELASLYARFDAPLDESMDRRLAGDLDAQLDQPSIGAARARLDRRIDEPPGRPDARLDRRIDGKIDEKKDEAADEEAGPAAADRANEASADETDKKQADAKLARDGRKGGKRTGKAEVETALAPPKPRLAEIPDPELGLVPLAREPPLRAESAPSFTTPEPPALNAARPPGAKPEPPSRDELAAPTLFRDAMAAARRLYEELVADAATAGARVQSNADRLAALRQRDFDRGLDALARGLAEARIDLDRTADAALLLIGQRERATFAAIQRVTRSALGRLGGAKTAADKVFDGLGKRKDEAKKSGAAKISEVKSAGEGASKAVLGLEAVKRTKFPTNLTPLPSAQNEKIGMHLAGQTVPSAKVYSDEAGAEEKGLTATFKAMGEAADKQFTDIKTQMTKTASSSSASVVKSRDGALKQLKERAEELRASVAEARAGGHSALVKQHNLSRRQLVVSYRERGRGESQSAQQRASRGTSAALALATGQQTGARTLAETLERERKRPPAELAKVVNSSATAFVRNVGRTRAEQRVRVMKSAEAAELPALRQADATSIRMDGSAATIVERLRESGDSAGTSLTRQIEKSLEAFDKMHEPVADAGKATVSSAAAGYASANESAGKAAKLAEDTVTNAMLGKGGGSENANKGAPAGETKSDGRPAQEIPAEFVTRAKGIAADPAKDKDIDA